MSVFPDNMVSFTPQFYYFFVGPISEWTAGLAMELKVIRFNSANIYLLAYGGYNNWMNPGESAFRRCTFY